MNSSNLNNRKKNYLSSFHHDQEVDISKYEEVENLFNYYIDIKIYQEYQKIIKNKFKEVYLIDMANAGFKINNLIDDIHKNPDILFILFLPRLASKRYSFLDKLYIYKPINDLIDSIDDQDLINELNNLLKKFIKTKKKQRMTNNNRKKLQLYHTEKIKVRGMCKSKEKLKKCDEYIEQFEHLFRLDKVNNKIFQDLNTKGKIDNNINNVTVIDPFKYSNYNFSNSIHELDDALVVFFFTGLKSLEKSNIHTFNVFIYTSTDRFNKYRRTKKMDSTTNNRETKTIGPSLVYKQKIKKKNGNGKIVEGWVDYKLRKMNENINIKQKEKRQTRQATHADAKEKVARFIQKQKSIASGRQNRLAQLAKWEKNAMNRIDKRAAAKRNTNKSTKNEIKNLEKKRQQYILNKSKEYYNSPTNEGKYNRLIGLRNPSLLRSIKKVNKNKKLKTKEQIIENEKQIQREREKDKDRKKILNLLELHVPGLPRSISHMGGKKNKRKLHKGPRGGYYYIRKGKKVYVKK